MLTQLLIKKEKNYSKLTKGELLQLFVDRFESNENHQWITKNNFMYPIFMEFFEKISQDDLKILLKTKEIVFLRTSGKLSCALTTIENAHIIILYPDLVKLLNSSAPQFGQAVLAHELGHIIKGHINGVSNTSKAQIEADNYAVSLGYGEELMDVLSDYTDFEECRVRIQQIAQKLSK